VSLLHSEPISAISIKDGAPKLVGIDDVTISIVVPFSPNSDPVDLAMLLDSIYRQNFPGVEVLILSEDASKWNSLLDDKHNPAVRIRHLIVPPGTGASAARNRGAADALGNILAFLDDDVILGRQWCKRCVNALTDSSVGAVTGRVVVRLAEYGLDFVPESLRWVLGGTYWNSYVSIPVFSAAGMNFCIKKEVFLKAGGYNENLGPKGDRPEVSRWQRLGAEESDLVLRVWLWTKFKVVYDPNIIVEHKLRLESILPGAVFRRALHVGHNRAYIHSLYHEVGKINDAANFRAIVIDFVRALAICLRKPVYSWKRISFMSVVVLGFTLGYLVGMLHFWNRRTCF